MITARSVGFTGNYRKLMLQSGSYAALKLISKRRHTLLPVDLMVGDATTRGFRVDVIFSLGVTVAETLRGI